MIIRANEPPLFHAEAGWDDVSRTLFYRYNGRDAVAVRIPGACKPLWRRLSDGDICSTPMCQHMTVTLEEEAEAVVSFSLSPDAVNMRPRRAVSGEAILGQCGRPLIAGANGMYDAEDDLLISWHGRPWKWLRDAVEAGETCRCEMAVTLGPTPWTLLFQMQYYRMHLGYGFYKPWERKPDRRPITGWCSWEAFHNGVSAENVEESARFLEATFKDFGLKYVQIDAGYQQSPQPPGEKARFADTFLTPNEKFPAGHADIAGRIAAHNLQPGIWTDCAVTNEAFAAGAPFVVKEGGGMPARFNWLGYLMDCEPDTLRDEVYPLYRGLVREGYAYFKVDTLRHLYMDGLRSLTRDGRLTNAEAQRRFRGYLESVRKGIGEEAYLLACWGVMPEAAGVADACRIATDADDGWPQVRMQLFETARWYHTHRVLFANDPDHICARAPIELARSVLSLTSLSGGLLMISDPVDRYDRQRVETIRRTIPALDTMTAETGMPDTSANAWGAVLDWEKAGTGEKNPFGSLWCVHFARGERRWAVAGRFALERLPRCRVPFAKLGLDPSKRYAAYDFWSNTYLGVIEGSASFKPLEMGACQVVALHPVSKAPFVLASDRHVSMDAVSVLDESYERGTLKLRLSGVPGHAARYAVWFPEGFVPAGCEAQGAKASMRKGKGFLSLRLQFEGATAKAEVRFEASGEAKA